jgi:hypothetical protein
MKPRPPIKTRSAVMPRRGTLYGIICLLFSKKLNPVVVNAETA